MELKLRILLIIALIFYFICIFRFLNNKMLSLKYSLLWLIAGVFGFIFVIFPGLLDIISKITDIKSAMNSLFAVVLFVIIIILMSITAIVSRQTERIKELVQDNAFLEKRIRELEGKIK